MSPARLTRYLYFCLFPVLLLSGCSDSKRETEIKNAFGFVLGDDAGKLKGLYVSDNIIEVCPRKEFRDFYNCRIYFNQDKKIYAIAGWANYDFDIEAERELKAIKELFEAQYQAKFTDETEKHRKRNPDQFFYILQKHDKSILLTKSTDSLRIDYWDNAMSQNFKDFKAAEKISQEKKNNNNINAL